MSRLHGRRGRLYAQLAASGAAIPVPFVSAFSMSAATDQADVTTFGDANHAYVTGLPDAKGSWSGFYDDSTDQFYTAALDGIARNFYWYPDVTTSAKYFYGQAFFDFSFDVSVSEGEKVSGNWVASGNITKV